MKNVSKVYECRETIIVKPFELDNEYLHPEKLMLQFDKEVKTKPVDIGSWAYADRAEVGVKKGVTDSSKYIVSRPVVIASFQESRRALIVNILDYIYTNGNVDESNCTFLRNLLSVIDWCDENHFQDFNKSEAQIVSAYKAYTNWLYHQIHNQIYNPETANKKQRHFKYLIGFVFPKKVAQLSAKIPTIQFRKNKTPSPSADDVNAYIQPIMLYTRKLARAVMNDDFPIKIEWDESHIVHLPSNKYGVISEYHPFSPEYFDFHEARFMNEEELKQFFLNEKDGRSTYRKAIKAVESSNQNKRDCVYRILLASKVARGYAILLQALTGINPSDLKRIEYEKEYSTRHESVKQDLVSVKFRAGGKPVYYPLGTKKGLILLKEYIKFRDWYLNGSDFQYLFFTIGVNRKPKHLPKSFSRYYFEQLKGKVFDSSTPHITPTELRKHKGIIVSTITDSHTKSAESLNHSESVNKHYYSLPSQESMSQELSNYWNAVSESAKRIKVIDLKETSNVETVSGHCDGFGTPEFIGNVPIKPNCRTQFGCLYCEHYVCHADEEDFRKIFSLKYVIDEIRMYAINYQHSDELFRELSVRIEAIIDKVLKLYPMKSNTISAIRHSVYELGVLTPFWESKLQRYESLGVVL